MGLPISPKEIADIAAWSEGKSSIGEWPVEKLLSHIAVIEAKLAEVQHFLADEKAVRRNAEAQLASAHDTLDYFGHSPPYDGSQAKANKVRIAALETKCRELEAEIGKQEDLISRIAELEEANREVHKVALGRYVRIRDLDAALREAIEYVTLDSEYPLDMVNRWERASTVETIVKCPECCCSYVAGSDHASVCPDRHKETKANDAIATSFKPHSVANLGGVK